MTWVQMQEYCTTIKSRLAADAYDTRANEMLNSMVFEFICASLGQDSVTARERLLSRAGSVVRSLGSAGSPATAAGELRLGRDVAA